jgi:methyl-accepting chemotaxis protein
MIEGSISKVEDGTKIATETAEALNEIVEAIGKVTTW